MQGYGSKDEPVIDDPLQRELPQLLPRLWRFALRLTRNAGDAEDLVQRSCVRALERRLQWQPGSAMLSWLFSIMHSIWLNELRSAQRRREASLDSGEGFAYDDVAASSGDPEQGLWYRQVVMAVEQLPEAQRLVMLLVAVEGMSYREASDVLGLPIGTVMSRLSRARSTIGERFLAGATAPRQGGRIHEGG
jgi:RNA polymerase sigma-70 factor, ECF subfamily